MPERPLLYRVEADRGWYIVRCEVLDIALREAEMMARMIRCVMSTSIRASSSCGRSKRSDQADEPGAHCPSVLRDVPADSRPVNSARRLGYIGRA
jgi:hypothetical protein